MTWYPRLAKTKEISYCLKCGQTIVKVLTSNTDKQSGGYMQQPIYLVVGTPGSGKTWVCKQLETKFAYLSHDDFINQSSVDYTNAAARLADYSNVPILIETPFSVSKIVEPLMKRGFVVIPVFIIETEEVTSKRYEDREGRPIIQGHLSRIATYINRAREMGAFKGTSQEVLDYLKKV